ncbi:single-stranded DNA-binding protein [Neolewinella maritima]|nr:single-stranded DNA-binding protein [Neolewinella maritima]
MQIRNSVTLIGNVGQLPITKTLSNGNRVIEFSLATNDSYRNREGQKITRTEWHRVKAYGKVVDVLERYLTRGSRIALVGAIRYSKWTDKYEQTRTATDIVLSEFTFLDSKERDDHDTPSESELDEAMQVSEPSPAETAAAAPATKTRKRRATKKSAKASTATPAEDLPF